MEHLEKLLKDVIAATQRIEASRKMYAAQIAPDFNAFNYIQTNELMLSRILADLLDPSKSHAQGDLFLKGFLKLLACDWFGSIDLTSSPEQKIKVDTEVQTKASRTQRSMDIYLTIKSDQHDIGLCIENKPFASDQGKQMVDYYKELENRKHSLFHLVYLKYDGSEPSEYSVSKDQLESWLVDEKITILSYADLVPWLESCLGYVQNIRVEVFVKEFIGYIQKNFLGVRDMSERHEIVKLVTQSASSIDAAFLIGNSISDLKIEMMNRLFLTLKEKCSKRGWSFKSESIRDLQKKHFHFFIFSGRNGHADYGLCIEFMRMNNGSCLIGLRRESEAVSDSSVFLDLRKVLADQMSWEFNDKSEWWPAFAKVKYKHWDTNPAPWIAIQNGEMVQLIIAEAEMLFDTLKKHEKLHLLRAD